jgi:hypothetical protein
MVTVATAATDCESVSPLSPLSSKDQAFEKAGKDFLFLSLSLSLFSRNSYLILNHIPTHRRPFQEREATILALNLAITLSLTLILTLILTLALSQSLTSTLTQLQPIGGFTKKEKSVLSSGTLRNKEYLLDRTDEETVLLVLTDLLFAFCFDHR